MSLNDQVEQIITAYEADQKTFKEAEECILDVAADHPALYFMQADLACAKMLKNM